MTSESLPEQQALALREQVAVRLRWLNKLQARLQKTGFPPNDPLFFAAVRARETMQDLHTAAHYASCKHGVGKPEEKK